MTDDDKPPTVAQAREWVATFYNERPGGWLERSAMVLSDAVAAHDAREPLVQEVIRHATDFAALSMVAVDIPFSEHAKRTVARIEARSALLEAARKLAEWKP